MHFPGETQTQLTFHPVSDPCSTAHCTRGQDSPVPPPAPPLPTSPWAALGWVHREHLWRCSWASWRVASSPPEALADQARPGPRQPLGGPLSLPDCSGSSRAQHGGHVDEGERDSTQGCLRGCPTQGKAHEATGLGTLRHSQIPLLTDFLRPLHTCKNGTRFARVQSRSGTEIQGPPPPAAPVPRAGLG